MKLIDTEKVNEILRNLWKEDDGHNAEHRICYNKALQDVQYELDNLNVKEAEKPAFTSYVVTRSEEHADYVEEVFFDENKAQEYCDQFKRIDNEYARYITKVKVTL